MSDSRNSTSFSALAGPKVAVLRVVGPGVCRDCGRFENALLDVEKLDRETLVLDLSECPRIDSTFAGALLRLASRLHERRSRGRPLRVVLAGLKDQVSDVLDTLCVRDVFENVALPLPALGAVEPVPVTDRDRPREEILALSLDGHQRLSELNPENAARFEHLLPLLRGELDSLKARGS